MSGIIRNNSKNLMSLLQVRFPGGGASDPVVIFHTRAASVLTLAPLSPFHTCSPDYLKRTESLPARVLFTHAAVSGGEGGVPSIRRPFGDGTVFAHAEDPHNSKIAPDEQQRRLCTLAISFSAHRTCYNQTCSVNRRNTALFNI